MTKSLLNDIIIIYHPKNTSFCVTAING